MSMVLEKIYEQLNNIMSTNTVNEKEKLDESTQSDQISELTQEIHNMGKALAILSEKTNTQENQLEKYQKKFQNIQHMNNRYPRQNYYARRRNNNNRMRQQQTFRGQWDTPKPYRWRSLGKYCHSCGNCDHWSAHCKWKKYGHNNQATWHDKKGGSLENCRNT